MRVMVRCGDVAAQPATKNVGDAMIAMKVPRKKAFMPVFHDRDNF